MSSPKLNNDGSISLSKWVGGGGRMVRRDALDVTHPEHLVNVIERLGGDPDLYGYRAERVLRDQLLAVRNEITAALDQPKTEDTKDGPDKSDPTG